MLAPVRETWNHRSIVRNLTERELKAKYKKSVLGWVWSLLNPLATLMIYSIVFGAFLKIEPPVGGNGDLQVFALYLFAALVMWNFFNAVVNGAMGAMTRSGLADPEGLPPARVHRVLRRRRGSAPDAASRPTILAAIMIVVGNASLTFLFFPFLLRDACALHDRVGDGGEPAATCTTATSATWWRSRMNFLFYATPIVYTITIVPEEVHGIPARAIIEANPMTQFVQIVSRTSSTSSGSRAWAASRTSRPGRSRYS